MLSAFVACAGDSSEQDGDDGGSGGSAGSSGSSNGGSAGTSSSGRGGSGTSGTSGAAGTPNGGSAGTPSGGNAGTSSGGNAGTPSGGAAGEGGVGGSAGGGAGGGSARECETADDCVLFTDCCSCMGLHEDATPPYCDLVCIQSRCSALQIGPGEVTCSFGRCVIDRSCNYSQVTCGVMPEPCTNGEVRSLSDGCWGACLPPTECREVTDCDSCGDAVCVIEEPQIARHGCVIPGDSCEAGSYCECLGACPTSGFVCTEADDAVHCPCPVC
jgi:hypothetical protein